MSVAQGYRSWAGFGRQTVLATPVARSIFTDFNSETLKEINNNIESQRLGSASQFILQQGLRFTSGIVNLDANFEGLESILKDAIGSVATTTPSGGTLARLQTYTLTDEPPSPGMCIEINKGGLQAHLYEDCKVRSLKISGQASQLLNFEVDYIGRRETLVSTSTPTFPALLPITQAQLVVQLDSSSIDVNSFEITINNNLSGEDRPTVTGREIKEPVRVNRRAIEGVLDLDYDSVAQYNKFKNLSDVTLSLVWTGGLIESGQSYTLTITFPKIRFRGETPSAAGPGVLPLRLPFLALATSRSASNEMSVTLKNGITSVA
jgi:hypothetical protein